MNTIMVFLPFSSYKHAVPKQPNDFRYSKNASLNVLLIRYLWIALVVASSHCLTSSLSDNFSSSTSRTNARVSVGNINEYKPDANWILDSSPVVSNKSIKTSPLDRSEII